MKISETIRRLNEIKKKFGDLTIIGGYLTDDSGLSIVCVVDTEGCEIFPNDPNGIKGVHDIEGVFLT